MTVGTAGIGLAVVRRLPEEGAHVFVAARERGGLDVVFSNAGCGEFAPLGAITWVAPGPTGTPGLAGLAETPEQAEALLDRRASRVQMRRLGTPDEIASAVVWLASSLTGYVTETVLRADGGETHV